MKGYDKAIIGGGIVGLATAKAMLERRGKSLLVLEAEDRLAAHQSGHNSGVIHSGLYYRAGSLKARLCVQGRPAMYRFCEQRGVPVRRCGKLIVATHQRELARLAELTITERGEIYNPIFRVFARFVFGYTATMETYLKQLGTKFDEAIEPQAP